MPRPASHSDSACGDMGSANQNPCATWQPWACRMSFCAAVSTPSATTASPRLVPIPRIAALSARLRRMPEVGDEAAIQLEFGDGQVPQVAQAGIAGAEIIQ